MSNGIRGTEAQGQGMKFFLNRRLNCEQNFESGNIQFNAII